MSLSTNPSHGFSSLLASLKFGINKKSSNKTETTTSDEINQSSLASSPPLNNQTRRHALSLDFSTAEHTQILEELIEFQHIESEARKQQRHGVGILARKRSFPKRSTSVYNNDETLYNAVTVGNVELTRQVLQNEKVDINSFQAHNWTALHVACRQGNTKMIKLLLEYGANTTLVNDEGMTPLLVSVTYGNFDAAACIIHDGGASCEEIRNGFQTKILRTNNQHAKLKSSRSFESGVE